MRLLDASARGGETRCEYDRLAQWEHDDNAARARESSDGDDEEVAFKAYEVDRRSRLASSLARLQSLFASPWQSQIRRPSRYRRIVRLATKTCLVVLALWVVATPIFNPSYTHRPAHYTGRNVRGEKVFVAANIVDEELVRGEWGRRLLQLVTLLGEENVFVGIYESDSGPGTAQALRELGDKMGCGKSIVSGHLDLGGFPTVQILPADTRVKRITYLAEARNRAIAPLFQNTTGMGDFDKLLFLNDVIFDPEDAADLLFATNAGDDGRARYHAACAMDFINPFKFYDTFASRDAEGYLLGVPFFPFFTNAGDAVSRADVLAGRDAVRVRSCWGGMVAFEAKWFVAQRRPAAANPVNDSREAAAAAETMKPPVRFRSSPELMWDASECCLVHADIVALSAWDPQPWKNPVTHDAGIYMNPYVRVAYDTRTHGWLRLARRFERLYPLVQRVVNCISGRPPRQARRTATPGQPFDYRERAFDGPPDMASGEQPLPLPSGLLHGAELTAAVAKHGHWETVRRIADPGGFCGSRQLLTLKPQPWAPGSKTWEKVVPPAGANDLV